MMLRSNTFFSYYDVAMTNIYIHLSGTLHNLITLTAKGYVYHVSGVVKPEKALHLHSRFSEIYDTELSRFQRARRKKNGKCNVRFFMHPRYTSHEFEWWLLATEGEGIFHERENPKSGLKKRHRLRAFKNYEAIIAPAKGDVPRWTWRLTDEVYKNWEARIQAAIRNRKDDKDLKNLMRELHSLPGFRGVRNQVAQLRLFTIGVWRRDRKEKHCPHLPKSVQPYLRFKTYDMIEASLVIERMKAGKSPYANKWKLGDKNE